MQNDAATLYCPNDLCQAPNPQNHRFCQQCRTPLIKRYLWAVGSGIEAYKVGELVGDRYLLKSNRILLDTKPGLSPETPNSEIKEAIKPYLRLVPYRLQVPQIYGLVLPGEERNNGEILLLEQAAIYSDGVPLEGQLMPELTNVWKDATSMRQLNWLWQMAQLFASLSGEGVVSTLIEPTLLRVEGSLLRLLELRLDAEPAPALPQLGQLWLQLLVPGAKKAIAEFLNELCLSLIQGEITYVEQLIAILDRGLSEVGRSQVRAFSIATSTDTGPSRQRNEDACYPPGGTTITQPPDPTALAIVCDGIGGHEGGNVASNLAIETIQQQVQQLTKLPCDHLDPTTFISDLERFACAANDRISQRNDSEHRHGRQRMGTTLVMALGVAHEIYMTHVGDSRAYWISKSGCHQVTLDDDVASREVRLGYALYRDALQQVSSGSLVQALGMSPSSSLHPTVQRLIIDEDCVFLLCSDGLSDFDRVEQSWDTEILPILDGKVDVATASSRLVEIGNTQNGHDNVTVGIVYCQVSQTEPAQVVPASLATPTPVPSESADVAAVPTMVATNNPSAANAVPMATQLLPIQRRRPIVPVLVGLTLLSVLGGAGLAYLNSPEVASRVNRLIGLNPSPLPLEPTSSSPPASPVPNLSRYSFETGTVIRIKSSPTGSTPDQTVDPLLHRGYQPPNQSTLGFLPPNALVLVTGQPTTLGKDTWLPLTVCSTGVEINSDAPSGTAESSRNSSKRGPDQPNSNANPVSGGYQPVRPGTKGWIRQADIQPFISSSSKPESGACPTQTPASSRLPSIPSEPPNGVGQGQPSKKPGASPSQNQTEPKTR